MLNAYNITLHYGSSQILHDVSVAAKLGEITCIMGSNGVGKTSLLRVLSRMPKELVLGGEESQIAGRLLANQCGTYHNV